MSRPLIAILRGLTPPEAAPVARALVEAAASRGLSVARPENFASVPGKGVAGLVSGRRIEVGADRYMADLGHDVAAFAEAAARLGDEGKTPLYAAIDGKLAAIIAVADPIKATTPAAIAALHEMGLKVAMISGDNRRTAEAVARRLGIDEVHAEVMPDGKVAAITALKTGGRRIAFVGDGVNDAPALARAEVGIAIGAGTDVAMESAGVVLASDDPRAVLSMIELSQASYRKMIQNLIWASGYNIVAVPLAAGVLTPIGILLPPAAAAVLMSLSTIVVALNAQLLRRIDLDPTHLAPTSTKEEHTTPTPASTAVH